MARKFADPLERELGVPVNVDHDDDKLTGAHTCVCNASCPTNCLAPVAKVPAHSGTSSDLTRQHPG